MMGQINWSIFFVSGSRPDDRRTRVTSTSTTTIDVSLHLHLFQLLSDLCESSSFVIRRSQNFKMTCTLNMFTFRIYDSNLPFKSFDLMLHESTATFFVLPKRNSHISSAPLLKLRRIEWTAYKTHKYSHLKSKRIQIYLSKISSFK